MTSVQSSILRRLPSVLPRGLVDIENESHAFQYVDADSNTAKTVYTLDSGPFVSLDRIEATIDGSRTTLPSSAYDTRQVNSTTGDDSVAFTDTAYYPDEGTSFEVSYRVVPVIERYVSAFDDDVDTVNASIDEVIDARQVDHASGDDLDRVGALFGEIGQRNNRTDEDYRAVLKSVARSFNGRGTREGMKFAIAAAVATDPSNVIIEEDFEKVGYTIEVDDPELAFISTAITDIAQLADPSGVELLSAPVISLDGKQIVFDIEQTSTTVETGIAYDSRSIGDGWTVGN